MPAASCATYASMYACTASCGVSTACVDATQSIAQYAGDQRRWKNDENSNEPDACQAGRSNKRKKGILGVAEHAIGIAQKPLRAQVLVAYPGNGLQPVPVPRKKGVDQFQQRKE